MRGARRRLESLMRLACRLWPREFRDRLADDMAVSFAREVEGLRARRGRWTAYRYALGTLIGTALASLPARFGSRPGGHRGGRREPSGAALDGAGDSRVSAFGGAWTAPDPGRRGRPLFSVLEALTSDLRYACRMLARYPGLTAVTVLTLGLAIGANTTLFGVIHAVLLEPLPYREPERLVRIWERHPQRGIERSGVAPRNLRDWRRQAASFDAMAFWGEWRDSYRFSLVGPEGSEQVRGAFVSSNLFPVLGVEPAIGRAFRPEDDEWGLNPVAIIGHGLWQRRFGGDPGIVGRTLTVDNYERRDFTIVGVMPPGFDFPARTELWLPAGWMDLEMHWERRVGPWLGVLARLRAGTSLPAAEAELAALQAQIAAQAGDPEVSPQITVLPLAEEITGPSRPALIVLQGAVLFVLLIACVNVANLLLANAAARRREIAVRRAVGGGRGRLLAQLLCESGLRTLLGGTLGVLLAVWGMHLVRRFGPEEIPRLAETGLNAAVLAFTLVVSLLAAVLFGSAPASRLVRDEPRRGLTGDAGRATSGVEAARARESLLVLEVALTFVLLAGAGLMLESLYRLQHIDPGFSPARLMTAEIDMSGSTYTSSAEPGENRPQVFTERLIERIVALRGVDSVAATDLLPPEEHSVGRPIGIAGRSAATEAQRSTAFVRAVTPAYFETMRVPLVRGRGFAEHDTDAGPPVVLVNETLARRHFPGADPVGEYVELFPGWWEGAVPVPHEIVGVVGDVRNAGLRADVRPEIYKPYFQYAWRRAWLLVRTDAQPSALFEVLRAEIAALNPDQPVPPVRSMEGHVGDLYAQPRFRTLLIVVFGVMALALATVGLYGVLSWVVAQRAREIGIRMALGARPGHLVGMVVARTALVAAAGIVLGAIGAVASSRLLTSWMPEIEPGDPTVYGAIAGLLALVALLAGWMPARRATRVDVSLVLRDGAG